MNLLALPAHAHQAIWMLPDGEHAISVDPEDGARGNCPCRGGHRASLAF